jgi:hypothetical protein
MQEITFSSEKTESQIFHLISLNSFTPKSKESSKNFLCPICKCLINIPVSDKNGHLFCQSCIINHIKNSNICPINSNEILKENEITQILTINKLYSNLGIFCPNKNCKWNGKISEIYNHIFLECDYEKIFCPNKKNGCNYFNIRIEVKNNHIKNCDFREIKCKNNCDEKLKIIIRDEEKHYKICPNEIIKCPQKCGKEFMRKFLDNHIKNECSKTLFPCKFNLFGCEIKNLIGDLDKHLKTHLFEHINLLTKYMKNINENFNKKIKKLEELKSQINYKKSIINKMITALTNSKKNKKIGFTINLDSDDDDSEQNDNNDKIFISKSNNLLKQKKFRNKDEDDSDFHIFNDYDEEIHKEKDIENKRKELIEYLTQTIPLPI